MTDRLRRTVPAPSSGQADRPEQLALPLLDAADVATLTGVAAVVDRFHGAALAARRWHDADELDRLGGELLSIIERAQANRRGGAR